MPENHQFQPKPRRLPTAVFVGITLAIVLDTVIQLTWKMALAGVPENSPAWMTISGALRNPLFYVAMTALAAQLVNWTRVLARADLSFAQPFTALSYVTVLAFSGRFLQEHLSTAKMGGVALIFLGVFLISRTPSNTVREADELNNGAKLP